MPHEIVSEEGPAEVLINPSTENLPVTEPDAGNLIIVEPAPTRIPTADEKQGILSAVSDLVEILTEKYPANMVTIKIDAGPNPDT